MRSRKIIAHGIVAAVALAGAASLSAAAQAAPASVAIGSAAAAPDDSKFIDDFWDKSECEKVGKALVEKKNYTTYTCEHDWLSGDWNLWVYW
ncbi:hypothetical protein [Actinoplanes teichomyceticus]|uniref:Uncharacterized protein n=1 Tax=Actinoplanes teichomyceticus TaxID=1867 RepID=A0A561VLS8_ACTTI|nr:hypothetical protein [Actinoplanes teichomyceticus]TWG12576.1 hypothetical protein FHX34_105443 [Actinoplanes teichomyceticus]GIF13943.1 hypothetical protein Ate01nite_39750 [Actinoplanes teichomyceticus]